MGEEDSPSVGCVKLAFFFHCLLRAPIFIFWCTPLPPSQSYHTSDLSPTGLYQKKNLRGRIVTSCRRLRFSYEVLCIMPSSFILCFFFFLPRNSPYSWKRDFGKSISLDFARLSKHVLIPFRFKMRLPIFQKLEGYFF